MLSLSPTQPSQTWPTTRLEKLGLTFPVMVAPMVGLTHCAFRQLLRLYTPAGLNPLLFTEMLSTRRIPYERLDKVDELRTAVGETHFVPQLLGNEETYIAQSIRKLLPLSPWGFDINMGCPAKQTLKHNWGVRLLGDADYAARVVEMTKKHSPLPVSVKMRCGQDKADPEFLDAFTAKLEAAGADWLTVHARTQAQKHKGDANWGMISDLAPRRNIPLVVNGDIQTAADAVSILQTLNVDGVMIGRAATARPWIIWQIAEDLGYRDAPLAFAGMKAPRTPLEEGLAFLQAMIHLIDFLTLYIDAEEKQLRRFRFHVINAHKWLFFGHAYYSRCMKAKSLAEAREMTVASLELGSFTMSSRITLF